MENQITVASCTIKDLFQCEDQPIEGKNIQGLTIPIEGKLTIPEYQRPYVWGKNEVYKLINDLKSHFIDTDKKEKPLYYLGSIILHKSGNKLNIIDGQQRIITLAIVQYLIDKNKVPELNYVAPATLENIKDNYNFIPNLLDDYKPEFDKININLIVTPFEDDAYTFFETQNTGGVRLSGIDIIKAHHLREVPSKGTQVNHYASIWEAQKNIDTVVEQLIKARRWNLIHWKDVPSDRDLRGTKQSIIKDFSEKTLPSDQKMGFQSVISKNHYTTYYFQLVPLAIRQPLANGENFIDYLKTYTDLYFRLFKTDSDFEIHDKYYDFNEKIIQYIDGTTFLKELYEIALMSYVSKFGIRDILEASLWIFRYTYTRRLSNRKTVREKTIPSFVKEHPILDIILSSFTHKEVVNSLQNLPEIPNEENTELGKNSVKRRYIDRVAEYFEFKVDKVAKYDQKLVGAIKKITNEQ